MKYIRHHNDGFIIFPNSIEHIAMKDALYWDQPGSIISAGQIIVMDGQMHCAGNSMTLGIESSPADTVDLQLQLDRLP